MTGIRELFAELSEPDEFHAQAQLELWCWRRLQIKREAQQRYRVSSAGRAAFRRHESKADRKAYKRAWDREYKKRRRKDDPIWAEKLRARQRKNNRLYEARIRAARRSA